MEQTYVGMPTLWELQCTGAKGMNRTVPAFNKLKVKYRQQRDQLITVTQCDERSDGR